MPDDQAAVIRGALLVDYMHCFILSMCCARISGDMSFICASIIAFRSCADIVIIFLCMSHMAVISSFDFDIAPIESEGWDMDGVVHPLKSVAPMIMLESTTEEIFMVAFKVLSPCFG